MGETRRGADGGPSIGSARRGAVLWLLSQNLLRERDAEPPEVDASQGALHFGLVRQSLADRGVVAAALLTPRPGQLNPARSKERRRVRRTGVAAQWDFAAIAAHRLTASLRPALDSTPRRFLRDDEVEPSIRSPPPIRWTSADDVGQIDGFCGRSRSAAVSRTARSIPPVFMDCGSLTGRNIGQRIHASQDDRADHQIVGRSANSCRTRW